MKNSSNVDVGVAFQIPLSAQESRKKKALTAERLQKTMEKEEQTAMLMEEVEAILLEIERANRGLAGELKRIEVLREYMLLRRENYQGHVGEYNFKCYLDAGNTKNSIKLDSKCETVKQYDADHNEILTKSYFAYDYDSTKGNTSSTTKAYIYKNIDGEKTCPVYRRVLEDVLMQPDRTKSQFNDEGNIAIWQQTVEKTMDDPTYFRGWQGYYGGVQLNLIYKKSDPDKDNHTTITCRTTPFYENKDQKDYIYNDTYSITLDIDELCNDETKTEEVRNIFKLFKNGCRWGVATLSQPKLTFKLIDINTDEYNIIDIPNKIVWKYKNDEWVDSGDSIYNYIFAGTQYYNSITDSMYWSDINKTVTHLTFGNIETWTFEDFDGNTITKNILVR
jgi:hypothetical protein